jgi:DNA adenine methylase
LPKVEVTLAPATRRRASTRAAEGTSTGPAEHAPVRPFLKWAGGKQALAATLEPLFPSLERRVYREPFLGGGAMFFHLRPRQAVLSDALADLIVTYEVVRDDPRKLLERLERLEREHSEARFYEVRESFNAGRKRVGREKDRQERAAWLMYLNRTCYNGLFRTNQSGEFNVPLGRYRAPRIADAERVLAASRALASADIRHAPFEVALADARKGDFVYLDPPYVPLSATSSFAAYADGSFDANDQARLARWFKDLDRRGCLLALSNSDTPLVRELYGDFDVTAIDAPRSISARGSARGSAPEVVVRNRACVKAARG